MTGSAVEVESRTVAGTAASTTAAASGTGLSVSDPIGRGISGVPIVLTGTEVRADDGADPAAGGLGLGVRDDAGMVALQRRQVWEGARPGDRWVADVLGVLRPEERAVVVLGFRPDDVAIAHRVVTGRLTALDGSPLPDTRPGAPGPGVSEHRVREVPDAEGYAAAVRSALGAIADGTLDKVVLGRCLEVVSAPPLRPRDVLARLLADRPGRYVFCVPLGGSADAPVLLGASPELLVRRHGALVASTPLAGSVPRSADPAEDRRRAASLLDSAKDRAEHAFVVDAIVAALEPWCTEVSAPARPELLATDTLWHLASPIRARLSAGGPSALHLARLLHPTPAVGGVPGTAALSAIDELEDGPRGPLAGAVGWVDAQGDGAFAVAIRAGVLHHERLRLFAGAGIVAGSDPAAEVAETGAKLATMARAVGL